MAYTNETFEQIIRQEFKYLETDFSFHIHKVEKNVYGCHVMFKGSALGIEICFEVHEGHVSVRIYRLKDGEIPKYPIFFDPKAEFLIFYFDDLMLLKTKHSIEQNERSVFEYGGYMKRIIKEYAENLRIYGADLLNGDFSVFPEIHKIVARRAGYELGDS
jgi:hypothetical protein